MKVKRRSIVLIAISLLLILDAARSINARYGYDRPQEMWQPDAKVYADLTWPPGANVRSDAPTGERVYAQRCAVCHGPDGRGNGPAAPSFIPRPRDFTLGLFKYKSTLADQMPTDQDLENTIANGLPASAMPYFRDLLNEAEIHAVAGYVKKFSSKFDQASSEPVEIPQPVETKGSIDRGRALYIKEGCAGCHGPDGRTGGYMQDAKNYPVPIRDLTAPWTFRGGKTTEQVWLRLTTGLAGSSMPSYVNTLTPEQRWDVVNYLQSIARAAPWESGGILAGPGHHSDLTRRGEYFVHAEMCGLCHTQINRTGIYRADDRYLAGGMRVGVYPHGVYVSRNLTSDKETGLGLWSHQQVVNAFRNGRTPTRLLNVWAMPWFLLHHFKDDDALAIARYLKKLPAVRNRIPDPLHYGIIETISSKLTRSLPAANVTVLTYADGNFGRKDSRSFPEKAQQTLIILQWFTLIGGVFCFLFATERGKRFPRTIRAWLILIGCVAAFFTGWILNATPTLGFIPAEQIAQGASAGIPEISGIHFATQEQKNLAERGRYLYSVASCAFCHRPDGAGGNKVSWKPFGTLWTRNITPDPQTGIGKWSDQEIARAIRSGITPDGRTLHWQGMIWDHASNWDEEDVRAIIAYLRVIPAVHKQIPLARPPAADDCDVYTFWVAESNVPGCK